jgi:hypothetical protein
MSSIETFVLKMESFASAITHSPPAIASRMAIAVQSSINREVSSVAPGGVLRNMKGKRAVARTAVTSNTATVVGTGAMRLLESGSSGRAYQTPKPGARRRPFVKMSGDAGTPVVTGPVRHPPVKGKNVFSLGVAAGVEPAVAEAHNAVTEIMGSLFGR